MQTTAASVLQSDTSPETEDGQVPSAYSLRAEYNNTAHELRDVMDFPEAYHKLRREQYDKRLAAEFKCEEE